MLCAETTCLLTVPSYSVYYSRKLQKVNPAATVVLFAVFHSMCHKYSLLLKYVTQISREIYDLHISPIIALAHQVPHWSDNDVDDEAISGNKPPGLCDQDVYVLMNDSARQLIIGTHSVSYHFSFGLEMLLVIISWHIKLQMRWYLCLTSLCQLAQTTCLLSNPAGVKALNSGF